MKRIAQFFAVGLLLCVLAGCSNQPSASSNSPLPSASPSSKISPTPVLSPSATVAVSPNTAQATTGSEQKPGQAKPTQKPGNTVAKATQKPAATQPRQTTAKPAATPTPEPPAYRDAISCRSAMMKGINAARAEEGYNSASTSSSLNSIAQERARQMAANQSVSHIGSGYPEAIGCMSNAGSAYNNGYVGVAMHVRQLLECSQYGLGIAIGRDGKYYYSIIGQ